MRNDFTSSQLAQEVTITLPLGALLRLNDASIFTSPTLPAAPKLNKGERYVGCIISAADINLRHHIVLLPGDAEPATWSRQMQWARDRGGEPIDLVEGALLAATMKDEFKQESYWTRKSILEHEGYAWFQIFGSGLQSTSPKSNKLRARAVRRIPIGEER